MDFKKYFSGWDNDRLEKRFYQFFAVSLVCVLFVAILGIIYVAQNNRVVLVPTTLEKSIWVSADDASDEYFSEMAVYFANYRLSFTPQTVDFQFKNLLKYVTPQANGILTGELNALASDIKGKNYSQVFFSGQVEVMDKPTHMFLLKGVERHFIGSQQIEELSKEYQIQFQLNNGKIYVSQFKEAKGPKVAAAGIMTTN